MTASRFVAALVTWAVLAGPWTALAQNYLILGAEQFFRVSWETGRNRRGDPIVSGYIYNDYGAPAANVRVMVEELDAAGRVVDRQLYPLAGTIPNYGRAYFEFKVPGAASHRVVVASWDWMRGGGGGGG
jgi:hypothetical protein